jgi:NodT family efflux transporter outer membrane factor (OMF) lipoprotein
MERVMGDHLRFRWNAPLTGSMNAQTGKPASLMALALLSACAVGPDYKPPTTASLKIPDRYATATPGSGTSRADLSAWWANFNDPVLNGLMERALAANLDIAQGVARLRQARASLSGARAERLPSITASGGGGRDFNSDGPDNDSFSGGADAAWEADIFGGRTREIEASRADFEAAGYDLGAVRTSIAAELASNYVQLRALQARLAIARENLAAQDETLQIAQWRVQAGLVSSLDSEQARASRAQTAATIPSLEASLAATFNRIGVLIGEAPGSVRPLLAAQGAIPKGPENIATGIPADTISQRPDVRASERALAAATARIGSAKAQLYPALRLSGNIGTSALSLGGLGDVVTGGLFAAIAAPLFDGGRIRSQIDIRTAQQEAALAAYRQSVLTALEDVENALASLQSAYRRHDELAVAYDAANNAAILARSQYRAGLTDFQTLLSAERTLLSAQDGLASADADRASALIQLYRALGGGWQPTNPQTLLTRAGTVE